MFQRKSDEVRKAEADQVFALQMSIHPAALEARITALDARIVTLDARNAILEARLAGFEARLTALEPAA